MAGFNLTGRLRVELGKPEGPPISIGFLAGGSMHQLRRIYGLVWSHGAIGIIRTGEFEPILDEEEPPQ